MTDRSPNATTQGDDMTESELREAVADPGARGYEARESLANDLIRMIRPVLEGKGFGSVTVRLCGHHVEAIRVTDGSWAMGLYRTDARRNEAHEVFSINSAQAANRYPDHAAVRESVAELMTHLMLSLIRQAKAEEPRRPEGQCAAQAPDAPPPDKAQKFGSHSGAFRESVAGTKDAGWTVMPQGVTVTFGGGSPFYQWCREFLLRAGPVQSYTAESGPLRLRLDRDGSYCRVLLEDGDKAVIDCRSSAGPEFVDAALRDACARFEAAGPTGGDSRGECGATLRSVNAAPGRPDRVAEVCCRRPRGHDGDHCDAPDTAPGAVRFKASHWRD